MAILARLTGLSALLFAASGASADIVKRAAVVVAEDAQRRAVVPRAVNVPLVFAADGEACADRDPCPARRAEGRTPDGAFSVVLKQDRPPGALGETLTIEGKWRARAWVNLAAVELAFAADQVTVWGRDLRPVKTKLAVLERFDPKWIVLERGGQPVGTLLVDDTLDAVVVRAGGGEVVVRLELDAALARPFLHDARCTSNWRAPNKHLPEPMRLRLADETVSARVQLLPGAGRPVVKSRFPDGRRAALVFTDHADQSSPRTFEALVEAFVRHKLQLTKALFWRGTRERPQLEDARVLKLAEKLREAGSEIIPHSATPKPDERSVTQTAMKLFQKFGARTWIDHQPETNCEAFGDQGFRVGGKFGIADLLVAHGYDYVWAEVDAKPPELNLLQPRRLHDRAPTVWPVGRLDVGAPDGLWMFRSVWAFLGANHFYTMYSAPRLDRLEAERGLHISHTYLETYHPKRTLFGMKNLIVPADPKGVPGGPGAVKLDPRFDKLLAELAARESRGTLWVPTLATLGDRMRRTSEVQIVVGAEGNALLRTAKPLPGATFVVPGDDVQVQIGGRAPRGQRSEGGATWVWDDLPAGDTPLMVATKEGAPLALFSAP